MFISLLRIFLVLILLLSGVATAPLAADWTRIGPQGGSVMAVASAPSRPSTLYAGLSRGQVYRSTDRGQTWSRVSSFASEHTFVDLVVDPLVPSRVFAATSKGLFRSTDGAATWVRTDPFLSEPSGVHSFALAVHPRRPAILLSSFTFSGVLFRSTDRGRTWTRDDEWPINVRFIEPVPAEPGTFWLGSWTQRLWRSRDAGKTWTLASRGIPAQSSIEALAVDPRTSRIAYATVHLHRSNSYAIYKTSDGGSSWRQIRPSAAVKLTVDARGVVYGVFEGQRLYRSLDGGSTWTRVGAELRRGITDLETTPSGLLASTVIGVYRSIDQGTTWRSLSQGLSELSIAGLAITDQNPPRLYASDPLAGIFKTASRGASWLPLGHPDPGNLIPWELPLAVSPADPEVVYAGVTGAVAKSTNGGRSWQVHGGLTCLVVRQLLVDPQEPSTLYASGGFYTAGCGLQPNACILWRSLDAGESWSCTASGLPNRTGAPLLGVDPFTSAVYVQVSPGDLWKSTDRGNTWTLVYPGLNPSSALVASARTPGTYYIGRQGEVARSRDSGQTWQFFSTGLPGRSFVHVVVLDPTDDDVLYAGLDEGVFKSTDAGETWSRLGTWPAVQLTELVIDPREPSILYAGTAGEGVLRYEP
ncbi:MAG TPA: hypothetical protein VJ885_01940 [Thermoanaerobaculia bacterium]|nr:hypothetical protein [Thermoanaerobaculia bacterium]